MAENKTVPTDASVDDFLAAIDHPVRQADGIVLKEMFERISGYPAVMWGPSIIGFGQSSYRTDAGREGIIMMIGFSPRKSSLSLYMSNFRGRKELQKRMGKHKQGKGCLYINKLADIDLDILEEIATRSFEASKARSDDD